MRCKGFLLLLLVWLPHSTQAQTKEKSRPRTTATSTGLFHVHAHLALWQENIKLQKGTTQGNMETLSEGVIVGLGYTAPFSSSRWRQNYGVELGVGRIKGKGSRDGTILDELDGQLWYSLGAIANLSYLSSPVSEIGLLLPIHQRRIHWQLQSGSDLDPDRDSSYSIGTGVQYLAHISTTSSLSLAMIYHHQWQATMWELGWRY